MSDTATTDDTEHSDTTSQAEHSVVADSDTPAGDGDDPLLSERFRRWVNYLLLAGLSVVALVSGVRVYTAVDALITRFISPEFQQLFHGAFNLALLLLAVAGITYQLRRMQ